MWKLVLVFVFPFRGERSWALPAMRDVWPIYVVVDSPVLCIYLYLKEAVEQLTIDT